MIYRKTSPWRRRTATTLEVDDRSARGQGVDSGTHYRVDRDGTEPLANGLVGDRCWPRQRRLAVLRAQRLHRLRRVLPRDHAPRMFSFNSPTGRLSEPAAGWEALEELRSTRARRSRRSPFRSEHGAIAPWSGRKRAALLRTAAASALAAHFGISSRTHPGASFPRRCADGILFGVKGDIHLECRAWRGGGVLRAPLGRRHGRARPARSNPASDAVAAELARYRAPLRLWGVQRLAPAHQRRAACVLPWTLDRRQSDRSLDRVKWRRFVEELELNATQRVP